jgi:hypothetical protein
VKDDLQPEASAGVHQGEVMSTMLTVNIAPIERVGRTVIGLLGVAGGVLLLAGAGSAVAVVLELLLILAGLDLVVTGATGHCPLYKKLGHMPASLRAAKP